MADKIARTDRFLAREPECPVVKELSERGFLRVRLGKWVELSCPDCGARAYYVLPSECTPLVGVYACTCGMTTASLLALLKISEFDADWRDKLVLQDAFISVLVRLCFERLIVMASWTAKIASEHGAKVRKRSHCTKKVIFCELRHNRARALSSVDDMKA